MNPAAEILTIHRGAVRSGEWNTGAPSYKARPVPDGFRHYAPRDINHIPEPFRQEAARILAKHPRTKWVVAPRYEHPETPIP